MIMRGREGKRKLAGMGKEVGREGKMVVEARNDENEFLEIIFFSSFVVGNC